MAFDAYLYLDGVEGEATQKDFKGWIELNSFSWGVQQSVNIGASTGAGAGKIKFNEFKISKHTDKASPKLFLACCKGSHYKDAKLFLRKAGGDNALQFLKYEFNTVFISNIEISGSDRGDEVTPIEEISFVFGKVNLTYTPQKEDGSAGAAIVGGWDAKEGHPA